MTGSQCFYSVRSRLSHSVIMGLEIWDHDDKIDKTIYNDYAKGIIDMGKLLFIVSIFWNYES